MLNKVKLMSEVEKQLNELAKQFERAEQAIKHIEVFELEGVVVPAINELRYAGKHLSQAVTTENEEKKIELISKAISHAKRAEYDSYDAGILFCIKMCADFDTYYKNVVISSIYPNFNTDKRTINKIKKEIAQEDRTRKEEYFDRKKQQFTQLSTIYEEWDSCKDELNKLITQQKKQNIISYLGWIIAICIGLLSYIFK